MCNNCCNDCCAGCSGFEVPKLDKKYGPLSIDFSFAEEGKPFKQSFLNNTNELFASFVWEGTNYYNANNYEAKIIAETMNHGQNNKSVITIEDQMGTIYFQIAIFDAFPSLSTPKKIYLMQKLNNMPIIETILNVFINSEDIIKTNLYSLSITAH